MSEYTQTTLALIIIMLGLGVTGSVLGILWYRMVAPSSLDRDTVLFIIRLFMGIAFVGILAAVLIRYVF